MLSCDYSVASCHGLKSKRSRNLHFFDRHCKFKTKFPQKAANFRRKELRMLKMLILPFLQNRSFSGPIFASLDESFSTEDFCEFPESQKIRGRERSYPIQRHWTYRGPTWRGREHHAWKLERARSTVEIDTRRCCFGGSRSSSCRTTQAFHWTPIHQIHSQVPPPGLSVQKTKWIGQSIIRL